MTWKRVLTAAVLIPVVAGVVWLGSTGLVAALTGLVLLLALVEFFGLGERMGMRAYRTWTGLCAIGVLFAQWTVVGFESWTLGGGAGFFLTRGSGVRTPFYVPVELVLSVFVVGVAVVALGSRRPLGEMLPSVGMSAAGLLVVALPLTYLVPIYGVEGFGRVLLLFVLVMTWVGDTLAYFVGRTMGRTPMAAAISPKKTWEGAAANLLGAMLVGWLFTRWLPIEPRHVLAMAVLGNIAGQAGDLLESAYKRSAGVKDSGGLLPGHGGVLDRIDALILTAPVVWYYFTLVVR